MISFRITRVFRNTFSTKRDPYAGAETRATGLESARGRGRGSVWAASLAFPRLLQMTKPLLYYFGPTRGEMKQINNCCSQLLEFETSVIESLSVENNLFEIFSNENVGFASVWCIHESNPGVCMIFRC